MSEIRHGNGSEIVADIQQLVDEMAERLQRSIAIDDPQGFLIASSRHFGDEDRPRVNVVLSRSLDPSTAKYLSSFDIRKATDKVVIPEKEELQLKARCCYPLRHHGELLGFVWLIDTEHENDVDEVIHSYTTKIVEALTCRIVAKSLELTEFKTLGRQLLLSSDLTTDAAARLKSRGFASSNSLIRLIAVTEPTNQRRNASFPRLHTITPLQEWIQTGHGVIEVELDTAAVAVCDLGHRHNADIDRLADSMATSLADSDIRIGISEEAPIEQAPQLLRQALFSAYAGHVFTELGTVSSWVDLYPYRLLTDMVTARPHSSQPPRKIAGLFEPANEVLLTTLESYLDSGGDRSATARLLFIHRSTLYYRLSQIQRLTGLDLAHGPDRLSLHLATKLHRIGRSNLTSLLQTEEIRDG